MKKVLSFLLCAALIGCTHPEDHASTPPTAYSQADLRLMWQTQPMADGSVKYASTEAAVLAAERVFSHVELVGLSRHQVIALLGDPRRSSNSGYNFPFYPAPPNSLVYRFDTGTGGWQFNVLFDQRGLVREVQRGGIE